MSVDDTAGLRGAGADEVEEEGMRRCVILCVDDTAGLREAGADVVEEDEFCRCVIVSCVTALQRGPVEQWKLGGANQGGNVSHVLCV